MINLRFNKMLKEQGFQFHIFTMNGGSTLKIMYDDSDQPISADQLQQRYEYFKQAQGCAANTEPFKLVVPLKTYYVRLDV